jgi:hypothetical protein
VVELSSAVVGINRQLFAHTQQKSYFDAFFPYLQLQQLHYFNQEFDALPRSQNRNILQDASHSQATNRRFCCSATMQITGKCSLFCVPKHQQDHCKKGHWSMLENKCKLMVEDS